MDEALSQSKELRDYCAKYPELESFGRKLVGLEKNYATHAAGIVIGDCDLSDFVPLRIDKNGVVSVQYEKNRCEEMGLIKMDLLGLEHLRILSNTIKNAAKLGQKCPEPEEIPLDDKAVWAEIAQGRTVGVFQCGTAIMMELCRKVKPTCIEDLSLVNALIRPGASKSIDVYVARREGREKISYKYECLRPALQDTLGIGVYEEQLMKLASSVAGWDLNKADGLRKLTKLKGKNPELAERLKQEFIDGAMTVSGVTRDQADDIWVGVVEPFSQYGFNACLDSVEKIDISTNNGVYKQMTIKEMYDTGERGFIKSRDEQTGKDIYVKIKDVHNNGKKDLFEFKLDNGTQVRCTMDHKFRVSDGRMLPISQILKEGLDIVSL
jgi:DNA polymerase-3 subunit alpha